MNKKYFKQINIVLLILFWILKQKNLVYGFSNTIYENTKKSVVEVSDDVFQSSSYTNSPNKQSKNIGFFVGNGLILTSNNVGRGCIGSYTIRFYNGKEHKAKLIYYDPWLDISVLKVDPQLIPNEIKPIKFNVKPEIKQNIFVLDTNFGNSYSTHEGEILDTYNSNNFLSHQAFTLNLINAGCKIGSPVIDSKGESLGIVYDYKANSVFCIPAEYIDFILKHLKSNRIPPRKHIGAIFDYYSISDAIKYRDFPHELNELYKTHFKNSNLKVLIVESTLKGSPANKLLLNGDIIWKVNGKLIGPNLFELDMIINNAQNKVQFEIIRNGRKMSLDINTYDLQQNKIKKVLKIGNQIYFQTDEFTSRFTSANLGSITTIDWASLGVFFLAELLYFDTKNIENLEHIIEYIPQIKQKKYYSVGIKIHGHLESFSNIVFHRYIIKDLEYNNISELVLYSYDQNNFEWQKENLQ